MLEDVARSRVDARARKKTTSSSSLRAEYLRGDRQVTVLLALTLFASKAVDVAVGA
jgi:hypothetical protein